MALNMDLNLDDYLDTAQLEGEAIAALPTDKLRTNPQARTEFLNIAELADSIKEVGQLQPILVTQADAEGIHTLIAGERRVRACQLIGIDVECIIRDKSDKDPIVQLVENIARDELSYIDIGLHLQRIQADNGYDIKQLAIAIGKSVDWVSRHLKIANAGSDFTELLEQTNIDSIGLADELEKVHKKQPKVAKQLAAEGATRGEVRKHVKKIKSGVMPRIKKAKQAKPRSMKPLISCPDINGELQPITLVKVVKTGVSVMSKDGVVFTVPFSQLVVVGAESV